MGHGLNVDEARKKLDERMEINDEFVVKMKLLC